MHVTLSVYIFKYNAYETLNEINIIKSVKIKTYLRLNCENPRLEKYPGEIMQYPRLDLKRASLERKCLKSSKTFASHDRRRTYTVAKCSKTW